MTAGQVLADLRLTVDRLAADNARLNAQLHELAEPKTTSTIPSPAPAAESKKTAAKTAARKRS